MTENANDEHSASTDGYVASLGAQMWVESMYAARHLIKMIPEDDRKDVLECIHEMWTGNDEEVAAAKEALHEIIDDPAFELVRML